MAGKGQYASTRRVDGLEHRIEAQADSTAALNEIICDLRARLLPTPVSVGYSQESPVIREASSLGLESSSSRG